MPQFFLRRPSVKKPKAIHPSGKPPVSKALKKKRKYEASQDDEVTSEEEEDYVAGHQKEEKLHNDLDLAEETPQEKKARLAEQYLKELKKQREEQEDDEELQRLALGQHLREEILEASGRLRRTIADEFVGADTVSQKVLRSKYQKQSITCVVTSSNAELIFSASKEGSIVKWSLQGEKLGVISRKQEGKAATENGHSSSVYSLAISSDDKYLASGDKGGSIHIWNPDTLERFKVLQKHRGAVSGLAFQLGTHTLYSASHDRMVMVWNLDVMAFVEHLGGHQDAITGIDALARESCITSGGHDETIIVYVIVEDKQLIFSGYQVSIDGVKLVNEKTFVSFGQNGSLALWSTNKKQPQYVVKAAHGLQENREPYWITAVGTCVNTDLIASGSSDGKVHLWKVVEEDLKKKLERKFSVDVCGIVNSLSFTSSGSHLVVGVGREHKLGRWFVDRAARNCTIVIPLIRKS